MTLFDIVIDFSPRLKAKQGRAEAVTIKRANGQLQFIRLMKPMRVKIGQSINVSGNIYLIEKVPQFSFWN